MKGSDAREAVCNVARPFNAMNHQKGFFFPLKFRIVLCAYKRYRWRAGGNTRSHTQIPRLIATVISAIHHRLNYTRGFLLTCRGFPSARRFLSRWRDNCRNQQEKETPSDEGLCLVSMQQAVSDHQTGGGWGCVFQAHFHFFFFQQSTFTSGQICAKKKKKIQKQKQKNELMGHRIGMCGRIVCLVHTGNFLIFLFQLRRRSLNCL